MCVSVHLVIARFDEDVAWLQQVVISLGRPVVVFVYDKGCSDLSQGITVALEALPSVTVVQARLPNVGRESHTYLEHVVRGRHRMSTRASDRSHASDRSVTVFLQGRMDDHVPAHHVDIASFVTCMVAEAAGSVLGESSNHACHTQYGSFNALHGMRVAMYPGVGDVGLSLGDWFSSFLTPWRWTGNGPSEGPSWWQHGVFAIRTCRLMSSYGAVDDAFYRRLRSQVDWHVNPESGHYLERSWCYVFPPLTSQDEGSG